MHNTDLLLDQGTAHFILGQYRYTVALIKKRDWSSVPVGAFLIILGTGEGTEYGSRIFWSGYVEANTLHLRSGSIRFRSCDPIKYGADTFTFGGDEIKALYWPLAVAGAANTPGPDQLNKAAKLKKAV